MPCRDGYASDIDAARRHAATLYVYAVRELMNNDGYTAAARIRDPSRAADALIPRWLVADLAKDPREQADARSTPLLCGFLRGLDEQTRDGLVYGHQSIRDPLGRQLADWWEAHRATDTIREAKEGRPFAPPHARRR